MLWKERSKRHIYHFQSKSIKRQRLSRRTSCLERKSLLSQTVWLCMSKHWLENKASYMKLCDNRKIDFDKFRERMRETDVFLSRSLRKEQDKKSMTFHITSLSRHHQYNLSISLLLHIQLPTKLCYSTRSPPLLFLLSSNLTREWDTWHRRKKGSVWKVWEAAAASCLSFFFFIFFFFLVFSSCPSFFLLRLLRHWDNMPSSHRFFPEGVKRREENFTLFCLSI